MDTQSVLCDSEKIPRVGQREGKNVFFWPVVSEISSIGCSGPAAVQWAQAEHTAETPRSS